MKKKEIVIMKQDKGRGVVIMDRTKYIDKCLRMLQTPQFTKLDTDPTKTTERKVQNLLRKIKAQLPDGIYKKLYPSGSQPGLFYGLAKVHKLKEGEGVGQLPIRPIISNINTATYDLAKFLAKLLSPLNKSEYTISSTDRLLETLKGKSVPPNHKMVSFDVTSLFTNVPLEYTIDIILRRIYDEKEIRTNIPKKDMKTLLLLCMKNVHFSFNDQLYKQVDLSLIHI